MSYHMTVLWIHLGEFADMFGSVVSCFLSMVKPNPEQLVKHCVLSRRRLNHEMRLNVCAHVYGWLLKRTCDKMTEED